MPGSGVCLLYPYKIIVKPLSLFEDLFKKIFQYPDVLWKTIKNPATKDLT